MSDPSVGLLLDFFRKKGHAKLREEDRLETWYQDWIDFQTEHKIYASLLSPQRYSTRGHQFSILRLARFQEVFAFLSPAHAYSLQVSFLGLFPIFAGSNEALKQEAVARLEAGGLFAFAVSEQAHGADLLGNEFTLKPVGPGQWRANGSKYYIGNANAAYMISTLGWFSESELSQTRKSSSFVFFALRPVESPVLVNLRKIHTHGVRAAFVGAFEVHDHLIGERDIMSSGRGAWESIFGAVNLGKFFLGFGAVGICEHAFAEAYDHMQRRVLYGNRVVDMPHVRAKVAAGFARLVAMKLYAYRALDYMQASSTNERRHLLFNAVQKARVSTEGVKVIDLLAECMGARGLESETYFEAASRDARLVPGLEGSTHINLGITTKFMRGYFNDSYDDIALPSSVAIGETDSGENPCWFQPQDRNAKTVRFGHFLNAYAPFQTVPNVVTFVRQARSFSFLVHEGLAGIEADLEQGSLIDLGTCFSVIVYAQLIAENCAAAEVEYSTVSVIFHTIIEDLSSEFLRLMAMFPDGSLHRAVLRTGLQVPVTSPSDWNALSQFLSKTY